MTKYMILFILQKQTYYVTYVPLTYIFCELVNDWTDTFEILTTAFYAYRNNRAII